MSKVTVDWHFWEDERPEEEGTYLTYWSDGALETFPLDVLDIKRDVFMTNGEALLYWAENVAPPECA